MNIKSYQLQRKDGSDSLNMITNIAKENEGATITIPTNIPVVPPLNSAVIQQGRIHTQTQVQEY